MSVTCIDGTEGLDTPTLPPDRCMSSTLGGIGTILGRGGERSIDGGPGTGGLEFLRRVRFPLDLRVGLAAVVAAAMLAAPAVATAAADIPGNNATRATLKVQTETTSGKFEAERDSDWYKAKLIKGEDYAVYFTSDIEETTGAKLNVRDPSGRVTSSVSADLYTDEGFEFRAPRSGTYFVEALAGRRNPDSGTGGDYPLTYSLAVAPDCRDDATTQCSLQPGRPQQRATLSHTDWDQYRITLDRKKRYTFRVADQETYDTGDDVFMQVIDDQGRVLEDREFAGPEEEIAGFAPPRSGTYYLRVLFGNEDSGGKYTVSAAVD